MKKARRVQTLYSFKQSDGSLLLKGIYSMDTPQGIPQMIQDEVARGATTVRVLEWDAEVVKKKAEAQVKPEVEIETEPEVEIEADEPEEEKKPVRKLKKKKSE